jgi:hypothetical protein
LQIKMTVSMSLFRGVNQLGHDTCPFLSKELLLLGEQAMWLQYDTEIM